MTLFQRVPVYVIITLVILSLAWWATPKRTLAIGGIFLPATETLAAPLSTGSVQMTQDPNTTGTVLGQVNLQAYSKNIDQDTLQHFQQYRIAIYCTTRW